MTVLVIVILPFASLLSIKSIIFIPFFYLISSLLIQGPVDTSNFSKGMLIN